MYTYFDHICFSFSSCPIWPQFAFLTRTSSFPPCPSLSQHPHLPGTLLPIQEGEQCQGDFEYLVLLAQLCWLSKTTDNLWVHNLWVFKNNFLMLGSLSFPQHRYCFSQILYKLHDLEISKPLLSLANWNQTMIWKKIVEKLTDRQLNSQGPGGVRWFSLPTFKHSFILCVRWVDAGYGSSPA